MSASELIFYFSGHPAAFGFSASFSPDNITWNTAYKKIDQSLSDFQTVIGAACHAILDTEELISHTRSAIVDTNSSLKESDGGVIPVSEEHELPQFLTFWTMLCLNGLLIQLTF